METNKIKETAEIINMLGYKVINYNINSDKVGHIQIKSDYITGTAIGIIQQHFQILGISVIQEYLQITIKKLN